ncbi:hypothetical protein EYF80_005729 [Liparis tanakae]|uniref:Uncharacterized protein n=1 Tax=Liparis tanakae TaxID=230148 RepID=A0A4Z2J2B3_9TELE|nr:hypothetical protein EYF80_005729 [Liparis tanakae]
MRNGGGRNGKQARNRIVDDGKRGGERWREEEEQLQDSLLKIGRNTQRMGERLSNDERKAER